MNRSSFRDLIPAKKRLDLRLLLMALIVGLVAGAMGSLFRLALLQVGSLFVWLRTAVDPTGGSGLIATVVLSIIGIIISIYMVRKWAPEAAGSGIHEIEGALDGLRPMRWKRVLPV